MPHRRGVGVEQQDEIPRTTASDGANRLRGVGRHPAVGQRRSHQRPVPRRQHVEERGIILDQRDPGDRMRQQGRQGAGSRRPDRQNPCRALVQQHEQVRARQGAVAVGKRAEQDAIAVEGGRATGGELQPLLSRLPPRRDLSRSAAPAPAASRECIGGGQCRDHAGNQHRRCGHAGVATEQQHGGHATNGNHQRRRGAGRREDEGEQQAAEERTCTLQPVRARRAGRRRQAGEAESTGERGRQHGGRPQPRRLQRPERLAGGHPENGGRRPQQQDADESEPEHGQRGAAAQR